MITVIDRCCDGALCQCVTYAVKLLCQCELFSFEHTVHMSVNVDIAKHAVELRLNRFQAAEYIGTLCAQSDAARVMGGHFERALVVTA